MNRILLVALLAALTTACSKPEPAEEAVALRSGVITENFDTSVRPQDDLFRHVNGAWLARTEIPADRSNYGTFTALADKAEVDVKAIIEESAAAGGAPGSEAQKIGDLYASYMDEARAEELGVAPIQPLLASVDAVKSKADLVKLMADLGRGGVRGPFAAFVNTDGKQSDRYVVYLWQSGLSLPDRDYYREAKFKEKLDAFAPHVERMLTLAGVADAKAKAAAVVRLETELAAVQWPREDNRDDNKTYNKRTRAELAAEAPGFDWNLYFDALGAQQAQDFIVSQPSFFTAMAARFDSVPLATWKAWLQWRVVDRYAPVLNKAMVEQNFAFYGTTLNGTPEDRPRWKRAVGAVEGALGEAVGKLYVEKHFPPAAKARMDAMIKNLVAAYGEGIKGLEWMGEETKQKALAKLATFDPKIGYPRKWRDYSALEIRRDDLVGNLQRSAEFELARNLAKLGGPVDRDEWFMTPQTVNAYYNPGKNEIVFPAAILQPPFFDLGAEDAVNYGGIGAVIGHEIGHGFDDQGSKYDGAGNLVDWWTAADRTEFERRAGMLGAQYDSYEPLPGFKVNGSFTMGENIGDLGGVTLAHAAYRLSQGGEEGPVIDGYTADQRFFIGWAQVWARKYREDNLKVRLTTDPHSPSEYRANGTVRNVPGFYTAFDVKEGDALYLPPAERVKIW